MPVKNEIMKLHLVHDGCKWLATGCGFKVSGSSLAELDLSIKKAIINSGRFAKGSRIKIDLTYDFDTIPVWLRQYMPYYFNRHLEIEV